MNRTTLGFLSAVVLVGCASDNLSEIEQQSPSSGVTPTLLARGTYEPFKAESEGLVEFEGKAKTSIDIVTRRHDYAPRGHTGWHTHPGPVFITVTQGTLTFYEANDPMCTPHVVIAGKGYVDQGTGHIARNETDAAAQDMTMIIAPINNAPFRGEIDPPGNCPF